MKKIRAYATISKRLADDMQELFLKIGRSASITTRPAIPYCIHGRGGDNTRTQYHVFENLTKRRNLRDSKNRSLIKRVNYYGMVYCATVPNGTLIVRRDGRTMVCGNCSIYALACGSPEFLGGLRVFGIKRPTPPKRQATQGPNPYLSLPETGRTQSQPKTPTNPFTRR